MVKENKTKIVEKKDIKKEEEKEDDNTPLDESNMSAF